MLPGYSLTQFDKPAFLYIVPAILRSFGESFLGFSEEARTCGFASLTMGAFGFEKSNYLKILARIERLSIGRNRYVEK
jgi:hypothetical protein